MTCSHWSDLQWKPLVGLQVIKGIHLKEHLEEDDRE